MDNSLKCLKVWPVNSNEECDCGEGCADCMPLTPASMRIEDLAAVGITPAEVGMVCSHIPISELPAGLVNMHTMHILAPGSLAELPGDMHSLQILSACNQQLRTIPESLVSQLGYCRLLDNPMTDPCPYNHGVWYWCW